jgi:hypothetical protein
LKCVSSSVGWIEEVRVRIYGLKKNEILFNSDSFCTYYLVIHHNQKLIQISSLTHTMNFAKSLFIPRIAFDITKTDLRGLFGSYGIVSRVDFVGGHNDSNGFVLYGSGRRAFVHFSTYYMHQELEHSLVAFGHYDYNFHKEGRRYQFRILVNNNPVPITMLNLDQVACNTMAQGEEIKEQQQVISRLEERIRQLEHKLTKETPPPILSHADLDRIVGDINFNESERQERITEAIEASESLLGLGFLEEGQCKEDNHMTIDEFHDVDYSCIEIYEKERMAYVDAEEWDTLLENDETVTEETDDQLSQDFIEMSHYGIGW